MPSLALVLIAALACGINVAGESPPPFVFNVSSYAQVEQLANIPHDYLKNWSGSKAMVTLADNATAAKEALCKPDCRVQLLILETGTPRPGNLYKILAFRAAALALPAKTVILFTDCCDVLFLPSPVGGVDVFDAFTQNVATNATSHLAGAEVVMSVERGYSMITRADSTGRIKEHDHSPTELPANTMEAAAGVLDLCNASIKMCLQSKLPNSGSIIGYAQSLANMYDGACNKDSRCKEFENTHGNVSLNLTSDQNALTHYLLETSFNSSRIALDTDMALFHVTAGFTAGDYAFPDGHLEVLLPGSRHRIAINASVIHVPNIKFEPAASVMDKLQGQPNNSVMSKLQDLVALSQSSKSSKRKHRFLGGPRHVAREHDLFLPD